MAPLAMLKDRLCIFLYQQLFEQLARGILLYKSNYDDVSFFWGNRRSLRPYWNDDVSLGLKEEIHSVIALYRTKILDTASALALL
jgi:hypothetical protein